MPPVPVLLARLKDKPLSWRISWGLVLLALCATAAVLYHAARLRSEALDTHRTLAASVARVSAQQVTLVIQMIDRQLENRAADWAQIDSPGAAEFAQHLRADLAGMPSIRSIAVLASDGRVLASSSPDALGRRLGADAMTAVAGGGDAALLRISRPWAGRDLTDSTPVAGEIKVSETPYFFTVARRLPGDDSPGFILAVLNPDYFVNLLAGSLAKPGLQLALSRYDGVLLAGTELDDRQPGLEQATDDIFKQQLPLREIGLLDRPGSAQHGWESVAFHASRLYPLVLQVHFAHKAVLAGWRSEMLGLAAMSALALALLGVLGTLALRVQARREREQDEAARAVELAACVFDASFDGIMITDAAHRILRVNRAFTEVTGFTEAEVLGRSPEVLSSGLHDSAFYAAIWKSLAECGHWQGELTNRRRNGELYQEQLAISVLRDAKGAVCNYIGTFTDITERKRNEAALHSAKEAAEAANQAKSRFLATMSHEIRTPMNGILGMAQLLRVPGLSDADRDEYARTVLSSGETLMTLLNDILDLSRVEAGRLDLIPAVFEPAVLLGEAVALFGEAAHDKGLSITTRWAGAPGACFRADPIRLRQMLANLISNAIKFSHDGEILVEAEVVRLEADFAELRFAVSDCGIGIPPERIDALFQPFSQVDTSPTRAAGGSGLGLSIVRGLALLMDGDVGVRSAPGEGACFWFRIRAQTVAGGGRQAPRAVSVPAAPRRVEASAPLVLVVEDSPTNCKVIETMLQVRGYRVHAVENGLQAIDAIEQGTAPDLILMDCEMPVLDGLVATARIRDWEHAKQQPRTPIVAVTANAFEAHRVKCLEAGMDDFLVKPIVLAALNQALERWLPRLEGG